MATGKLYISGEYAVVDGGAAIVASVNRSIVCRMVAGEDERIVRSLTEVPSFAPDDVNRYVKAAAYIAQRFLSESNQEIPAHVSLDIRSELMESDGRKYGLGSSGAVTVAVLQALLESENLTALERYKLAVLALLLVSDNGSFGDIACSAFGQLVYYVRPSRDFLRGLYAKLQDICTNLHELIACEWDGLCIEPLTVPEGLLVCAGWTGSPASSTDLVNATRSYKRDCADDYAAFVARISDVSQRIRQACLHNRAYDFLRAYADASLIMSDFSLASGGFAETDKLRELKEIALDCGFVAKFSGAGGGDCGIAIGLAGTADKEKLYNAWQQAGIMAMDWKLS